MNNVDALKIGFIKRAQALNVPRDQLAFLVKKADGEFFKNISSQLGNFATQAKGAVGGMADQASGFLKNIDPNNQADSWKTALVGGLGGAAAGGIGTALGNIGEREENQGSVLANALKGLLAGGAIGGAVPTAKNYMDSFKLKETGNTNITNNIQQHAPQPQIPQRENIPSEILGENAPKPTRGNITSLLSSLIPGGPSLVNREAGLDDHLYQFGMKPAVGAAAGGMAGNFLGKGSPKARIIGALMGMFGGNMAGQSGYRQDQADKFTNAARSFTPESLIDNKNIATPPREQLNEALGNGDPSRILDAIRGISAVAPQREIPEQFSAVQDMASKESLPGWYTTPPNNRYFGLGGVMDNIGNTLSKK